MGEVAAVPETPAPAADNRHHARIPSAVAQNEGMGLPVWKNSPAEGYEL